MNLVVGSWLVISYNSEEYPCQDFGYQNKPRDSVEDLGDINSTYQGTRGGLAMIETFEG